MKKDLYGASLHDAGKNPASMLHALSTYIAEHGPIPCVRVSSAQASGTAKYSYWGAVRYTIDLSKNGTPCARAVERASSDRRSYRLAEQDADIAAAKAGGVRLQTIGELSETDAASVLDQLTSQPGATAS
jgi:hypothetical protein